MAHRQQPDDCFVTAHTAEPAVRREHQIFRTNSPVLYAKMAADRSPCFTALHLHPTEGMVLFN